MEERGHFTFYRSFYKAIMLQPKNKQRALFAALCEYALDGKEPELTGSSMSAFVLMKPVLDTARRKAEAGALKGLGNPMPNTSKTKQGENKTKQGENKTKQSANKTKQSANKTKQSANKGDIEIDTDIDTEIDTQCESEGAAGGPAPGGGTHAGEKTVFARFFESYPNAVGKDAVRAVWDETVQDEQAGERILESLRRWKQSPQWLREGGRFVPRAEKWLKERWFDSEPRELGNAGARGEVGQAELEAIRRIMEE